MLEASKEDLVVGMTEAMLQQEPIALDDSDEEVPQPSKASRRKMPTRSTRSKDPASPTKPAAKALLDLKKDKGAKQVIVKTEAPESETKRGTVTRPATSKEADRMIKQGRC